MAITLLIRPERSRSMYGGCFSTCLLFILPCLGRCCGWSYRANLHGGLSRKKQSGVLGRGIRASRRRKRRLRILPMPTGFSNPADARAITIAIVSAIRPPLFTSSGFSMRGREGYFYCSSFTGLR